MKLNSHILYIDKDKINDFEYDIAKALFFELYDDEYSLYEQHDIDNKDEKQIVVIDKNNRKRIVYLFNQPQFVSSKNYMDDIIVYYRIDRKSKLYKTFALSEEFVLKYEYMLNNYILNSELLYSLKYYHVFFEKYGSIPKILNDDAFKYYSTAAITDPKRNIDGGCLSFCNPVRFNDPFDCNIEFSGYDVRNNFRVLCTTNNYKNILMWSYYGDAHKGYCYAYNKSEILNALFKVYSGICFYGYVNYEDKRPQYKLPKRTLANLADIKHVLDCLFTKYKNWKHEEEFRFIIINGEEDFFNIYTNIRQIFEGCLGTPSKPTAKHLSMDKLKYDLF